MHQASDLDKWITLISNIKDRETICLNDASIINRDTWYSTLKRTYYRENRGKLLEFIKKLDREILDDLDRYKPHIQPLIKGLRQLSDNYQDKLFKDTINREIAHLTSSEILDELLSNIVEERRIYQEMTIEVGRRRAFVGLMGYVLQNKNFNKRLINKEEGIEFC